MKIPINGAVCGINADEIAATLTDIHYYVWLLQHWHPSTQHDAKEATAYKLLMVGGTGVGSASHPQPSNFPDPPTMPAPGI